MNNESVFVLSGWLKINGQYYSKSSEKRCRDGTKVQLIIYETSSKHFALIYPLINSVYDNTPVCWLNLKTCSVSIQSGAKSHKIRINTNNDLNCLRLVFKIEAKNHSVKDLLKHLKSEDQELIKPFGPFPKRRSVSRQTSLERVDEDKESV